MVLSRTFSWDDFYFTGGDYRLRIKPPLLDRYANLLREQFNSGVVYCGKRLIWDTVVFRKCQELARYLLGKTTSLVFTSPRPVLERSDTHVLREKILSLSQSQGSKLGIGKSTLHYLRRNAESCRSYRVYGKVREKVEAATV